MPTASSHLSSRIKVLFFSALRELTQQNEVDWTIVEPMNVGALWDELKEKYPALSAWDERVLIAVNLEYADRQTALADGDEVAFMPPVQGG